MYANSSTVTSAQTGPHPHLIRTVRRHLETTYEKPYQRHNRLAFAAVDEVRRETNLPIVLDSGCGTGASTLALARRLPNALVVGVDQSAARLEKGWRLLKQQDIRNCLLVRAGLEDFWRLASEAAWRLQAHYVLYPNPWPKASQLGQRWHGHPVFSALLGLGGQLEVRSNWKIYVEELAMALGVCGLAADVGGVTTHTNLSPFERKYRASGHTCWWVRSDLTKPSIGGEAVA